MPSKNIAKADLNNCEKLKILDSLLRKGPILFIGVGNILKSDDGAGVYISRRILQTPKIKVLTVEVSIENYISKINSTKAENYIIIDSMHSGVRPGYCSLVKVSDLLQITTHTHNISLEMTAGLFSSPVWVLGIQPATVAFGDQMSPEVIKAADNIISYINSI